MMQDLDKDTPPVNNASLERCIVFMHHQQVLLDRALGILHRMGTEQTGWRGAIKRWYYEDEPLRTDAANLVREAQFTQNMPDYARLVGDR